MAPSQRSIAMHSLLPPFLLVFLIDASGADGPKYTHCPDNTNYTRGGAFQANLEALLSSLPAAAAAASGFATNATGAAPDQAYGLAQCRADVDAPGCRACLDKSAQDMAVRCPGQKSSLFIYDECLLRHSNASFFGAADSPPVALRYWSNKQNVTQPERFRPLLGALMGNLTEKAAYSSPQMFAAGAADFTSYSKIYGMVQCTRDLAADDCNLCLTQAVSSISHCCDGKQGGRIIYPTCSIRFEVYSFYNAQAVEAAMSPAPAPPGGPVVNGSDHSGQESNGNNGTRTAILVSIPVAVVVVFVLLLIAFYGCKRNRKPRMHVQPVGFSNEHADEEQMRSSESLLYDLSTLRTATDNFSEENKLGEGGFGPVYKGILQNGQQIAVKRLSATSQQGQVEMKNEVVLVAKLQHKNLVRLLGCCIDGVEKILVYEFLINKSLDKILFDHARQQELSWGQRHKIIEGIGRGLLYLHEDSRLKIIHRDLKASNILLDADMNPKISDFGLAKLFSVDTSVGNTSRIAGTYGYMAPEYALHGIFSTKSDVFSYGVLVLEIVTGRRNAYIQDSEHSEDLVTYVWRHWSRGSVAELLDGSLPAEGRRPQEMLRCIHVGLLCVQEDAHLRPGMAAVVVMLNSRSITLPAPATPAFVLPSRRAVGSQAGSPRRSVDPEAPAGVARLPSIGGASISDLEPR